MEQQSGIALEPEVTGSSNVSNVADINEVEKNCHDIVVSIEEIGKKLPPPIDAECNIFRVPKRLLNINRKAYTPQVISIGPFHHSSQSNLMATEQHKLQALNIYLRRVSKTLKAVVTIAQTWETKARRCYAEPINMDSNKFVIMLLFDGCFIVEFLLLHSNYPEAKTGFDPSFYRAMSSDIYRDLTMLENQIPFFVLQDLFNQIPPVETNGLSLVQLTHDLFSIGLMKGYELPPHILPQNVKHLVDLLSFYFIPRDHSEQNSKEKNCNENELSLVIPPSVTELHEAGVEIKMAKEAKCVMDISFKNGVLEIPPLDIDGHFENNVRNLMAFEHYRPEHHQVYPIQYAVFFDDLISTEKDVRILVKAGIITNNLGGSDEKVSRLFNDVCKYVTVLNGCYYFNHISKALRDHCNRPQNKWMASLKLNHCNSPWAIISIFAAIVLIILTLLQTIFTGISTF